MINAFDHIQTAAFAFAALLPVMNPLAGAMIFLNLTHGAPTVTLNRLAKKIGLNTFFLLVTVLLTGAWILRFFGITLPIVQIGGGLLLASVAWKILSQPTIKTETTRELPNDKSVDEMAFFPLTLPVTAGPGCIAVTLTIGAHETHMRWIDTLMGQLAAIMGIGLCALTVWLCYRYAEKITHKLGNSGRIVVMRLSSFINLCIGLQIVWNGAQQLLTGIL